MNLGCINVLTVKRCSMWLCLQDGGGRSGPAQRFPALRSVFSAWSDSCEMQERMAALECARVMADLVALEATDVEEAVAQLKQQVWNCRFESCTQSGFVSRARDPHLLRLYKQRLQCHVVH